MRKCIFLLMLILSCHSQSGAQTQTDAVKDSLKEAALQATMSYPYIKSNKAAGVLPVADIEEKQDPRLQYKLVFAIASLDKGKVQTTSDGLIEVARTLNLHVAAGIPPSHINAVVVVFRQGLNTLLTDIAYLEKFKCANPNATLIRELQQAGVRFISCGQSMVRMGISKPDMMEGIKVSLSARTAFSHYFSLGFIQQ